MLFIRPSVDNPVTLGIRGTSGAVAAILSVVRSTEGLGHVVFDGTGVVDVALYA